MVGFAVPANLDLAARLARRVGCAILLPMARLRYPMTVVAGAALLVSCQPARDDSAGENAAANTSESAAPVLPVAEPPLGREDLLLAVTRAASASALGMDDRDVQNELDGDRFELRLRFGCPGIAGQPNVGDAFNVRFDSDKRTLRLSASPNVAADHPLVVAAAGQDVEAVEGFWVGRPWLLAPGCPAVGQSPAPIEPDESRPAAVIAPPASAPVPRVALAQFFTEADARTQRRKSRAYEATKTLAADEEPSSRGYNLVLSGRLKRLADGRIIACVVESADAPPACIVSAQFGRVWIERPDRRGIVAEWGSGG